MIVLDTSVAVAAALPWHEAHAHAVATLRSTRNPLLAHVGIETYSVLTRLPPPQRVAPALAHEYLAANFELPPIPLSGDGYVRVLQVAAEGGIYGGAIYDALVAATADEVGATLVTFDLRAGRTYDLLRIDYRILAGSLG